MKGVSEFVLVLLILIIAIASILVLWLFYNSMFGSVTMSEDTSSLGEALSSCMKIDSARDNKIYLRNCGSGVIKNDTLKVYFDEEPVKFSMAPQSLGKGEVGTVSLTNLNLFYKGVGENYKIRITSPSGYVERYVKTTLPSSCILYFNFDEGTGTIAHDSSGHGNDGVLHNGTEVCSNGYCPKWVDGKFGKALDFDGLGDFVEATDIPNSSLTIMAWVYPKQISGAQRAIVSKWRYPTQSDYEWMFRLEYKGSGISEFQFFTVDQDPAWRKYYIPLNKWSHFAVAYDRENVDAEFYSNLEPIGNYWNGGKTRNTTQPVRVGAQGTGGGSDGDYFNGTIDEVRIYNEVLTPDNALTLTLVELT